MKLFIVLIVLGAAVVTHGSQDVATAKGLTYLGVGYNILEGNPEGGELSRGGVDPGLLSARKILKLTWDTEKTSVDRKYRVPDQVIFAHHTSCVEATTHKMFSGTKSYQDKLKVDVEASAGYDAGLWNVAFSLSARYEKVNQETSTNKNVFFENKRVCNNGRARYQLDLARAKKYSVTDDFAAAVCSLPETYEQEDYFRFIENWGTDIVLEVELGTKTTERFESSYTEIAKYAMENIGGTVSVSGGYMGLSASLSVAFDKFTQSSEDTAELTKNKVVFSSGGPDMPAPIGLKLIPIDEAFSDSYFNALSQQFQCENFAARKENVKNMLRNYPNLKGARNPNGLEKATIMWADEVINNKNSISGQIPDGFYNQRPFTIIEYCCCTDGYATNPIILPTDSPFVLLKSNTHLCQKVRGMRVRNEYFVWDNDNFLSRYIGEVTGAVNTERLNHGDIKINYCYYY